MKEVCETKNTQGVNLIASRQIRHFSGSILTLLCKTTGPVNGTVRDFILHCGSAEPFVERASLIEYELEYQEE